MEQLKAELASVEQQLAAEKQKGPEGNRTIIERLEGEQAKLLEQIMLAEQQEREQKQIATIGTVASVDMLTEMFDALMPSVKYKMLLGINEYDGLGQDFKQLIQAYISETVANVYKEHELEIAGKDEKIRLLSKQGQEIQVQLDEANREKAEFVSNYERDRDIFAKKESALTQDLAEAVKQATDHSLEIVSVKRELEIVRSDRDSSAKLWTEAQAKIAELESKIEAAQKPKESKPSESLQAKMDEIKSKNTLSADDMIARFNARQKSEEAKVQVPDIPQVLPFQGEDASNSTAHTGNNESMAAGNAPVGSQFPTVTPPTTGPVTVPGQQPDSTVAEEAATKAWVRQQLEQLKQEIMGVA